MLNLSVPPSPGEELCSQPVALLSGPGAGWVSPGGARFSSCSFPSPTSLAALGKGLGWRDLGFVHRQPLYWTPVNQGRISEPRQETAFGAGRSRMAMGLCRSVRDSRWGAGIPGEAAVGWASAPCPSATVRGSSDPSLSGQTLTGEVACPARVPQQRCATPRAGGRAEGPLPSCHHLRLLGIKERTRATRPPVWPESGWFAFLPASTALTPPTEFQPEPCDRIARGGCPP